MPRTSALDGPTNPALRAVFSPTFRRREAEKQCHPQRKGRNWGLRQRPVSPGTPLSHYHTLQTYPESRGLLLCHPHSASSPNSRARLETNQQSREPGPEAVPHFRFPQKPFRIPAESSGSSGQKSPRQPRHYTHLPQLNRTLRSPVPGRPR